MRFHAIQSVLWAVALTVGFIAVAIVGMILSLVVGMVSEGLGLIVGLLTLLVYLGVFFAFLGGLLYAAIKAFGNNQAKLPIVGSFAEKWS